MPLSVYVWPHTAMSKHVPVERNCPVWNRVSKLLPERSLRQASGLRGCGSVGLGTLPPQACPALWLVTLGQSRMPLPPLCPSPRPTQDDSSSRVLS